MKYTEPYGFHKEFVYEGNSLSMQVIPFLNANEQDIKSYNLMDGEFLVHLAINSSIQSFTVFINDKLEWDSNVSKLVVDDKDLIEKIGFLIDDHYA